jgi:hypothetical protein
MAEDTHAVTENHASPFHEFEQGPVSTLFNTEQFAKPLYPETTSEPTGMGVPPERGRLFDRQRVADVINGGVWE